MAHRPMVRPHTSDFRLTDEPPPSDATQPEQRDQEAAWEGLPPSSPASDAEAGLSFDQFLQQLAERACLATAATASAIALKHEDQIVCRATAGPNAPDVGVPLNIGSGLSGACVRTRQAQYCEDTESDPRVNAAASRRLQVRSVLVVPLLRGEELLGIFEIFSPLPQGFARHDLRNLEALAQVVLEKLQSLAENPASPPVTAEPLFPVLSVSEPEPQPEPPPAYQPPPPAWPDPALQYESKAEAEPLPRHVPSEQPEPSTIRPEPVQPEPPRPQPDFDLSSATVLEPPVMPLPTQDEISSPRTEPPAAVPIFSSLALARKPRPRDWATSVLTGMVITLALLLGWMLGRVGWQHAAGTFKTREDSAASSPNYPKTSQPRNTPAADADSSDRAMDSAVENPPPNARVPGSSEKSSPPAGGGKPSPEKSNADEFPSGGLVVYQDGKVIFRQTEIPSKQSGLASRSTGASGSGAAENESGTRVPAPVPLPPQLTSLYLIQRVEPVYPEDARQHYIQGEVLFEAWVGKDGAVEELKLLRGNTELAVAAADAVRQWRFKPYQPHGKPVDFSTRLSVNFRLH